MAASSFTRPRVNVVRVGNHHLRSKEYNRGSTRMMPVESRVLDAGAAGSEGCFNRPPKQSSGDDVQDHAQHGFDGMKKGWDRMEIDVQRGGKIGNGRGRE
jgi:hypothetical protein